MWLSKYNSLRNRMLSKMGIPGWLGPLVTRLAIASVLVYLCYRFEWHWLRNLTAAIVVPLSDFLGLPVNRPELDIMEMNGIHYVFYISCTMIDVFFAASALMWNSSLTFARNLSRLVYLFVFVFVLNIVRLETGFQLLYRLHVPDIVEHEIVGGIAYFIVLVAVVETHGKKGYRQYASAKVIV